MEIDRCASAWLIKRYVDAEARFDFLSDTELLNTPQQSFDTPYSALRRTHNASTFEVIQDHYALTDDRVQALADLIHELEINFWNRSPGTAAGIFQIALEKKIRSAADNHQALQRCFHYLDSFSLEQLEQRPG